MTALTTYRNDIYTAIATANLADSTRKQYQRAIENAIEAGVNITDSESLASYAQNLNKSSKGFLKAGIRLWSNKVANDAKAAATPENVNAVQATVYRVEALQNAITIEATKGQKAHTWLSQSEVKKLLATCDNSTPKGKRDKLVLALLVGAGLRRSELASLTFDNVKTQSFKGKTRTVIEITGKGDKTRLIPISDTLAQLITDCHKACGDGYIARNVTKGGAIGEDISGVGIYHIVSEAGEAIGLDGLAPHDLRRTYAQIGYEAGIPITQISKLLGHSSIATTQRYLNLDLDLDVTISDFVPIA